MTASLTIIETRWTIEGEPDAVWVWADREGVRQPLDRPTRTPDGTLSSHAHASNHDPEQEGA